KDNRIDGAVLILVDIDELKRTADRLTLAKTYAETIVDTVASPLLILDARLRVEQANRTYYEMFGGSSAETEGRALHEIGARQWDTVELRQWLDGVLRTDAAEPFMLERSFPRLGLRSMLLNARRLSLGEQSAERILVVIEDRTEQRDEMEQRDRLLQKE